MPHLQREYVARNATEETLAEIWSEVLGVDRVGVNDNFFAPGGHSLLAMRVLSCLRTKLELDVPLRKLFEAPTVGQLSAMIAAG